MSDANAVAVNAQSGAAQLAAITEDAGFYSSLSLNSQKEKLNFLTVVSNSTPLQEKVGEEIAIKDVIIQTAQFVDDETAEVTEGLRTTLIDADGNAYHASSKGIALALRTAFRVLGEPQAWEEPLTAKVKQVSKGKFRVLTLVF